MYSKVEIPVNCNCILVFLVCVDSIHVLLFLSAFDGDMHAGQRINLWSLNFSQ